MEISDYVHAKQRSLSNLSAVTDMAEFLISV